MKRDKYIGKMIQIINCKNCPPCFDNITPNSLHFVIKPPINKENGDIGVWIDGIEERCCILFSEFKFVTFKRNKLLTKK
jgi:hypothetical protein